MPTHKMEGAVQERGSDGSRTLALVAAACAALVVVGSLGPWATVTAAFVGTFSVNGVDGDGKFSLGLGLVALLLAGLLAADPGGKQGAIWGLVVTFGLTFAMGIYYWNTIGDLTATVGRTEGLARAGVGWGLYAITFGSVAGATVALVQWRRDREVAHQPPPPIARSESLPGMSTTAEARRPVISGASAYEGASSIRCAACGVVVQRHDRFCEGCGTRLVGRTFVSSIPASVPTSRV